MGGRASAKFVEPQPPISEAEVVKELKHLPLDDEPERYHQGELLYELQGRGDFPSGRTYALLESTGRDWRIITRPADEFDQFAENTADRFGMDRPTLSWAKDGKAVHIYVDGMTTQDFLDHVGLELDLTNATTASKRLSRIFRPQAATGWFDAGV